MVLQFAVYIIAGLAYLRGDPLTPAGLGDDTALLGSNGTFRAESLLRFCNKLTFLPSFVTISMQFLESDSELDAFTSELDCPEALEGINQDNIRYCRFLTAAGDTSSGFRAATSSTTHITMSEAVISLGSTCCQNMRCHQVEVGMCVVSITSIMTARHTGYNLCKWLSMPCTCKVVLIVLAD